MKKNLIIFGLVLILLNSIAVFGLTAYTSTGNTFEQFTGNNVRGQQFVMNGASIDTITIQMKKTGSPTGTFDLQIWNDSGSNTYGSLLFDDIASLDVSTLTTSDTAKTFTISNVTGLTHEDKYWVRWDYNENTYFGSDYSQLKTLSTSAVGLYDSYGNINYRTTYNWNMTITSSIPTSPHFQLTAKNIYNDSAILNFTAQITNSTDTYTVTTSNGTIYYALQDELVDIKVYNITGTEGVYFNRTYTDYNTSTNLNSEHWQAKLIIDAYDSLNQSDISDFNFTINDSVASQFNTSNATNLTNFLTNADTYSYLGKSTGYTNPIGTVTIGSLETLTIQVNFTIGNVNIYGPFNSSTVFNYLEFESDCTAPSDINVSRSTSDFQGITSGYNYTFNDLGTGFYARIDSDACSWIEITTKQLYWINGTVKDSSGTAFSAATVYAIRQESDTLYKNTTDASGIFEIPVPWTGNYTVVGLKNSTLKPDADAFVEITG